MVCELFGSWWTLSIKTLQCTLAPEKYSISAFWILTFEALCKGTLYSIGVFMLHTFWYFRRKVSHTMAVECELLWKKLETTEKSKVIVSEHKWYLSCLVSHFFQNYFTKARVEMMDSCQGMTQSWALSYQTTSCEQTLVKSACVWVPQLWKASLSPWLSNLTHFVNCLSSL